MKLEEYEHILRTGTPSDRARAIAAASDDKEVSEEEFHQLTALIKGAVRPSARKMTPDEAKLWAEVSRVNTRLKQEMVAASFTVRALPDDLQEDAINILSKTVSGMLGDLSRLMAETGEPYCNGDDRRQWWKQGGAVGAAASRMQAERSRRWEPQPGLLLRSNASTFLR